MGGVGCLAIKFLRKTKSNSNSLHYFRCLWKPVDQQLEGGGLTVGYSCTL